MTERARTRAWIALVLLLLAARLPSLVQPAGGDQQLYAYIGHRLAAGDVPYLDAWDQKPPGIHAIYSLLWRLWPDESAVAAADLAAAALVAWLLVVLGRRLFSSTVGYAAASLFLLLGDPWLQRLGGVRVRAQGETFIALAIVAVLVLVTSAGRRTVWLALAGVWFAAAVWIKYNALAYALPIAAALWWDPQASPDPAGRRRAVVAIGTGFAAKSLAVLAWFGLHGALGDLWLATITYNLQYSQETYAGPLAVPVYLLRLPVDMARVDLLWYLGVAGSAALLAAARRERAARIVLAWVVAAGISIALNGARGLPQYFLQAHPVLALAAAAGLAPWIRAGAPIVGRLAVATLVVLGLWRVGSEPGVLGFKFAGLPGAWTNAAFDARHALGSIDRDTYLARFERPGEKYVPRAAAALADYVRDTTSPGERILVFGFSAGVYLETDRESASRFFWSRPVAVEFEAGRPGYGSAGLLADVQRHRPAVIALQQHWGSGDPDPVDFFMSTPALRDWLEVHYTLDRDMPEFVVWRRKG